MACGAGGRAADGSFGPPWDEIEHRGRACAALAAQTGGASAGCTWLSRHSGSLAVAAAPSGARLDSRSATLVRGKVW